MSNDNVINLQERLPHMTGEAICMECRHEWTAVAEIGAVNFECPNCSTFKGIWVGPCFADTPLWECNCGNEFFVLHEDQIMCARCGLSQHGIWD